MFSQYDNDGPAARPVVIKNPQARSGAGVARPVRSIGAILMAIAVLLGAAAFAAMLINLAGPGMATHEIGLAQGYAIRSAADTASADAAMARFLTVLPALGIVAAGAVLLGLIVLFALSLLKQRQTPAPTRQIEQKVVFLVLQPGESRVDYLRRVEALMNRQELLNGGDDVINEQVPHTRYDF